MKKKSKKLYLILAATLTITSSFYLVTANSDTSKSSDITIETEESSTEDLFPLSPQNDSSPIHNS